MPLSFIASFTMSLLTKISSLGRNVKLDAGNDKFSLEVIASSTESSSSCYVKSDADVNPFTRMMVEPALKGLFDEISKGMQAKYPLNL